MRLGNLAEQVHGRGPVRLPWPATRPRIAERTTCQPLRLPEHGDVEVVVPGAGVAPPSAPRSRSRTNEEAAVAVAPPARCGLKAVEGSGRPAVPRRPPQQHWPVRSGSRHQISPMRSAMGRRAEDLPGAEALGFHEAGVAAGRGGRSVRIGPRWPGTRAPRSDGTPGEEGVAPVGPRPEPSARCTGPWATAATAM